MSTSEAIYTIDRDLQVLSWNPAAERMYGYRPDEIIGQSLELLYPESRDRSNWQAGLDRRSRLLSGELSGIAARARQHGYQAAALMLDLDNFKYVNETFGHKAGDELVISIAAALKSHLRPTDVIARFGGDTFGLLIVDTNPEHASELAERLLVAVREHEMKYFPAKYVKIDGEFLSEKRNRTDDLVIESIVKIGRDLGKQTIAEYVSDEARMQRVRSLGVDYGQGYHFAAPFPSDQLRDYPRQLLDVEAEPSDNSLLRLRTREAA
jgi:diguanylate cyclase (GGDEF)-like protein